MSEHYHRDRCGDDMSTKFQHSHERICDLMAMIEAGDLGLAKVAEARATFAAADSEQRRLAEWVLEHCPGEPSQSGGVVDTVIRLITSARADGAAEERERIAAAISTAPECHAHDDLYFCLGCAAAKIAQGAK